MHLNNGLFFGGNGLLYVFLQPPQHHGLQDLREKERERERETVRGRGKETVYMYISIQDELRGQE